jgi:hypothetical protein
MSIKTRSIYLPERHFSTASLPFTALRISIFESERKYFNNLKLLSISSAISIVFFFVNTLFSVSFLEEVELMAANDFSKGMVK